MTIAKPVILTPQSDVLSDHEANLYAKHNPHGFILFGRHCQNPDQVKTLCADLKRAVGRDDCPILIDQEGGRVARMRGPHWPEFPAAAHMNGVYQTYHDIGTMLFESGVTVDCAPCLDVVADGDQCDAIGDRCFSPDPDIVAQKGIDACQGLMDAGVMPVIKHIPGHGRAVEDTHYFLPVVKASLDALRRDFKPFQVVSDHFGDRVQGMTAHILYDAIDPDTPASLSKTVIQDIIRGDIGFKGLLYSDDLAMKALDRYGDIVNRVHLCLEAGSDIALPCNTTLEETTRILESF